MKILTFPLGEMQTNCYFLIDEATNKCAVVDPGGECERILNILARHGLTVTDILLTHGHFDHMMALGELRRATHAPLSIHSHDAPALADPTISYMKQFGGIDRAEEPAERLLEEGDTVTVGETVLTVLHTPGHTPGSVCYLCGDKLISGDTLFRGSIGRYDLYGGDYDTLMQSLQRLAALEGDYRVYPGHGSSTTLETERKNNLYLQ